MKLRILKIIETMFQKLNFKSQTNYVFNDEEIGLLFQAFSLHDSENPVFSQIVPPAKEITMTIDVLFYVIKLGDKWEEGKSFETALKNRAFVIGIPKIEFF